MRSARLVAIALLAASLGACTATGKHRPTGSAPSTTPAGVTTTTRPAPATTTTTTNVPGPSTTAHDVADRTFPHLGDPRIDVASEAVTLRADLGRADISGHVTIVLRPVGDAPLAAFTLDLHGPKVGRATVGGRPARVTATAAEITIEPARPLPPHRPATVVIDYAGTPNPTMDPVLGVPIGWQSDDHGGWFTISEPNGTSTWVPVSDHPSDKAVWSINLDTPAGATGVSNGRLISHATAHGRTTWVWREREPMASYLVLVAVGHYDLVQRPGPVGTQVLFAFPPDMPAGQRQAYDALDGIMTYYGATFGGPVDDDAGAIVVDKPIFLALESQTRPLFGTDAISGGIVDALAHELGHQWFGDAVTLADWPDLWLNEGFATYTDWLYRDHLGKERIDDIAAATAARFANVSLTVRDPVAAGRFDMVVYERGALTLHALRKTVGDAAFFEILRTWIRRYDGRSATSDDFVRLSSQIAGRDLTAFFSAWLDHVPQPPLPR